MAQVEVKGLREAASNLMKLAQIAQINLSRKAVFEGALVVAQAIRKATYTTFKRRTGFVQAGFSVRVARQLNGETLEGYIVQREQNLSGSSPEKVLQRAAHLPRAKGRKQSIMNTAFYWRFLEFGTKGRRNARTAKKRSGKKVRDRYDAAKSLGDITPRRWVRPAFASSAAGAIHQFEKAFRDGIETEVNNLSK